MCARYFSRVCSLAFGAVWLCGCEQAPQRITHRTAAASALVPAPSEAPAAPSRQRTVLDVPACDQRSPRVADRRARLLGVDDLTDGAARLRPKLRACFKPENGAALPVQISIGVEPRGNLCGAELASARDLSAAERACLSQALRAYRFPKSATLSELVLPLPRSD